MFISQPLLTVKKMTAPLAPYLAPANCAPSGVELLAPDSAHFFKSGAVNPNHVSHIYVLARPCLQLGAVYLTM
jgi:hypothetical protein